MKIVSATLTVLGAAIGFIAAYYWLQASRVPIIPEWGPIEPGDERYAHSGITAGIMKAFSESSKLNQKAALWTGVSVGLAAAAGLIGMMV